MFKKIFMAIVVSVLASTSFAVTAQDQADTSKSDTELTRSIREKIVADNSLSMRAKNITIVSKNGQVILKGAVATAAEKTTVEEIARKTAGAQSVVNQTKVSTSY